MITAELIRRYPIFSVLDLAQLDEIVEIAEDLTFEEGEVIFRENEPAQALYILLRGSIDLFFMVEVEYRPELRKELYFDVIKPGDVFGISALIPPYILTSTARVSRPSRVIKIDAAPLLELCDQDNELAYQLMQQVAKAAIERINLTRLQLASALTQERAP